MGRRISAGLVVIAIGLGLMPSPAQADFHLMRIVEVFAGTDAAPNAQFIELKMHSPGQVFTNGHNVRVYNASGGLVTTFTMTDVTNGANQDSILLGTAEAQTMFGVAPDITMPTAPISEAGGKICFDSIDCVSWGSYSGSVTSPSRTGTPAPAFCNSLARKLGGNGTLEAADDTNNSAADFSVVPPTPRNNAGATASAPVDNCFSFSPTVYAKAEDGGPVTVPVTRFLSGVPTTVDYFVSNGTAVAGADYVAPAPNPGTLSFTSFEETQMFQLPLIDDPDSEVTQTIHLTLQDPAAGSIWRGSATIHILDDEAPDTTRPKTQITKPGQGKTYAQGNLSRLTGTASDARSSLATVQIALRQKLKNGNCRWLNATATGFVTGTCSAKKWRTARNLASWFFTLGLRLPKSDVRGNNVANYTAYSRAKDVAGNDENRFTAGRNANTFEIT